MKVLFISKHKLPHIGGVERHIGAISSRLSNLGYNIKTVSEEDIKPPNIKYFGLLFIWYWFLKNINLIKEADIIHIHDVFIWYLPFRFIFPSKKVYITFHGWEGKYPIPLWNIINKKIANKLTNGGIAVGKYIEKWYGIKADDVIYGGVDKINNNTKLNKTKNTAIWLGRQDNDTGINEFKKWLTSHPEINIKYISNDPSPEKYLKKAEYCIPSGYLSYLEAKKYGCKIITFANNPLKTDYWNEIKSLKQISTWEGVINVYIKMWKSDILDL